MISTQMEMPKRNRSAFILFSQHQRKELKDSPEFQCNSNQLLVKIAELWNNLSDQERSVFHEEARKEKEVYQEQLKVYEATFGMKPMINRTKKTYVKKPCSHYGIFVRESKEILRRTHPNAKMAEIFQILSAQWKTLDEAGKSKYKEMAQKERELFEAEHTGFQKVYRKKGKPLMVADKHLNNNVDTKKMMFKKPDAPVTPEAAPEAEEVLEKKIKTEFDDLIKVKVNDSENSYSTVKEEHIDNNHVDNTDNLLQSKHLAFFSQNEHNRVNDAEMMRSIRKSTIMNYYIQTLSSSEEFLKMDKLRRYIILNSIIDSVNCEVKEEEIGAF